MEGQGEDAKAVCVGVGWEEGGQERGEAEGQSEVMRTERSLERAEATDGEDETGEKTRKDAEKAEETRKRTWDKKRMQRGFGEDTWACTKKGGRRLVRRRGETSESMPRTGNSRTKGGEAAKRRGGRKATGPMKSEERSVPVDGTCTWKRVGFRFRTEVGGWLDRHKGR
jgi:hypothetical protein